MVWIRNKLEKTSEYEIIPGSPYIPGTEGTAGTPAYSYYETVTVPGATYVGGPPTGYDTEIVIALPGGGYQILQSGGYRFFDGVKAYLTTIIAGVEYIYKAPDTQVRQRVDVPAVPPVPATPPQPAVPAQVIQDYKLGWNAGAFGPATLLENQVFQWKWSAGNVGAVVGLTLATSPQDYSYTGMAFSLMAQSGRYQLYNGPTPKGGTVAFMNNDKFALKRTNTGTVELYINGALTHTEVLADDVVPDCSIYSGGDVIWDAQVLNAAVAPLLADIAATTTSGAVASADAVKVTKTVGPNTAIGVAGATTTSAAVCGAVLVNGSVYTAGPSVTLSDGVVNPEKHGAQPTFGAGTALGEITSSTISAAVAVGDATTGVGISTNVSVSSDCQMVPMTGAGSGPNVADGWTGNFVGDAIKMAPMTVDASGDLAAPVIGIGNCVMVPMNASVIGLTGETSVSSSMNMLPLSMFGSSEVAYSQGYGSMAPLNGGGTDEPLDDVVDQAIEILETVLATGDTETNYAIFIRDLISAIESTQTFSQLGTEVLDALRAFDDQQLALAVTVAEALTAVDTGANDFTVILSVIENILAVDSTQTVYSAIATVLVALGVSDNEIFGGSAVGATAGVSVQDAGPPSVTFTFTGYWPAGTYIALEYTTDLGTYVADLTLPYNVSGGGAMTLFTARLNEEPQLNAVYNGTSVTITATGGATTVQI